MEIFATLHKKKKQNKQLLEGACVRTGLNDFFKQFAFSFLILIYKPCLSFFLYQSDKKILSDKWFPGKVFDNVVLFDFLKCFCSHFVKDLIKRFSVYLHGKT